MKITFVLQGYSKHPIGGGKMVFEYANRLAERGGMKSPSFLTALRERLIVIVRYQRFCAAAIIVFLSGVIRSGFRCTRL